MTAPPYSTARVDVVRVPEGEAQDVVAVEEPLEIRIGGTPVAVTMRTPGHDEVGVEGDGEAQQPVRVLGAHRVAPPE